MMTHTVFKFEKFILKLLNYLGYESKLLSLQPDIGVDIEINHETKKYGVEVKLYRTRRISNSNIKNSLIKLNSIILNNKYSGGLLFITVNIDPNIREDLEKEYKIEIIDRGLLLNLTKDNLELRNELETILLAISQTGEDDIYEGIFETVDDYKIKLIESPNLNIQKVTKGQDLCTELNNIKPGKEEAKKFEEKCEKILKYLFENDLFNWQTQNRTSDTLHIFDLIAKISSTNDFWLSLSRDFRSRFVIFEFKNYTEKIKQGQVYTTEKYLFNKALRSIAFIITRKGADENAIKAMEGSLREYGKLIIYLDLEDLCKMLRLKDNGDDPNTFLSEKLDKILMSLSR